MKQSKDDDSDENRELARRLCEGRCPRSNSCSGTTPPAPHQHTRPHQSTQQHTTRARRTRAHQLGAATLCRLSGRQRTPRRSLCTLLPHHTAHHVALCAPHHTAPHTTLYHSTLGPKRTLYTIKDPSPERGPVEHCTTESRERWQRKWGLPLGQVDLPTTGSAV